MKIILIRWSHKLKVKKEINQIVWRKVEKTNKPKFDKFIMKVNVECLSYNNLQQDFKFMKMLLK